MGTPLPVNNGSGRPDIDVLGRAWIPSEDDPGISPLTPRYPIDVTTGYFAVEVMRASRPFSVDEISFHTNTLSASAGTQQIDVYKLEAADVYSEVLSEPASDGDLLASFVVGAADTGAITQSAHSVATLSGSTPTNRQLRLEIGDRIVAVGKNFVGGGTFAGGMLEVYGRTRLTSLNT